MLPGEIFIATGAFWINLDHQLRAEIFSNIHWGGTDPVVAVRRRVVDPVRLRCFECVLFIMGNSYQ